MKFLKYLLPCALAACGFAASVHAENGYSTTTEARERDVQALTDFVKNKGAISIQQKGGSLMLSGDVRSEWYHMRASNKPHKHGKTVNLRGRGSEPEVDGHKQAPFPTNEFDIEANLVLDYQADRSWAKMQLEFANTAGIREHGKEQLEVDSRKRTMFGSGKLNNLVLRKAYLGYNVAEHGTSRFDVEVGRRRLYDVFDSRVQFQSFFDGLTLKYANSFEGVMDLDVRAAAFVVDHTVNHFGYVGQVGLLNLADTGIDFEYSYIWWNKHGVNRYNHKHPMGNRFEVSQFTLAYNLSPDWISYKTQFYGAYLINSAAPKWGYTHHEKANKAFYVGMSMGEIKRQNDWALDVNYQWVQAQAIPEGDVSGIGRDNPRAVSFYEHPWGGFANYKGYVIDGLYALTDNLTLNAKFERVHQESKRIGGKHRSYQFKLAAVYAF